MADIIRNNAAVQEATLAATRAAQAAALRSLSKAEAARADAAHTKDVAVAIAAADAAAKDIQETERMAELFARKASPATEKTSAPAPMTP